jgi:hypothetical protein
MSLCRIVFTASQLFLRKICHVCWVRNYTQPKPTQRDILFRLSSYWVVKRLKVSLVILTISQGQPERLRTACALSYRWFCSSCRRNSASVCGVGCRAVTDIEQREPLHERFGANECRSISRPFIILLGRISHGLVLLSGSLARKLPVLLMQCYRS